MKPFLTLIALCAAMQSNLAPALAASAMNRPTVSVYFPAGTAKLTDEAQAVLDEAAESARQANAPRVIVVGYGDRSGSDATNYSIAASRASLVEQGLIARGIAPDSILMTAEAGPNAHGDGKVSFVGDRRTDIIIEPRALRSF